MSFKYRNLAALNINVLRLCENVLYIESTPLLVAKETYALTLQTFISTLEASLKISIFRKILGFDLFAQSFSFYKASCYSLLSTRHR